MLFLEHTLLVNSADVIAHLVLGLDVVDLEPATLLRGQRFDEAQIYGVVENDFFHQVSLGAAPVQPGVAEMMPEPVPVHRHPHSRPRRTITW